MTILTVASPAKINWFLSVGDKRPDGFHEISTVFQEVSLSDTLSFQATGRPDCQLEGFPDEIAPETNLVVRAWRLLKSRYPGKISGVHVTAEKRIPRGGGLGGGSSNAAATLKALNDLFALGLNETQLETLGAELGSDVPFFIRGGSAVGTGKGERLSPIHPGGSFPLILLFPGEKVATGPAYQALSKLPRGGPPGGLEKVVIALTNYDVVALSGAIYNDFERIFGEVPWFEKATRALMNAGCLRAFLCGSGATVAGLLRSNDELQSALHFVHDTCGYQSLGFEGRGNY